MKKILLTIAVLVVLAGFAFAGGGRQDDSSRTTLTYLAWNLGTAQENNLERRMLRAFQEANPNVALTILEVPRNADGTDGNYNAFVNSLAAQANLPDVFMWASIPDAVGKGWALNISDFTTRDADYQRVIASLRNASMINNRVFAVPYQAHLFGMAINLSIFNELNVQPPNFTYTIEELQTKIAQVTTNRYKGVDNLAIEDWGPFAIDSRMGFATFDGRGYNFTNSAYSRAIQVYREVVSRGQTGHGAFIEPRAWLPEGVSWAWGEGYIGFQYTATWDLPGFVNGERPFRADLLPLPNERVVLVPDYIFIGANTRNPSLAYELAKWMSYGEAGLRRRVELARANGFTFNGIPLAPGAYPEVDNFFLQNYRNLRNFTQLYQMISTKPQNVILESYKVVPGFARSRFEADTGVLGRVGGVEKSLTMGELINSIIAGERQLADFASEMERIANREFQSASNLLRNR